MDDTTPEFLESITNHPDVQRLVGQVVELQILVNDLTADKERLIGQVETLSQEIKAIETHMEMLIGLEEMVRLGADKQPQRDLSQRVMRIFAAHFDRND